MRIIKPGDLSQGWEGQWTCPHCSCVWELDGTESGAMVPRFTSDQRDGDYFSTTCPTCSHSVTKNKVRKDLRPGG